MGQKLDLEQIYHFCNPASLKCETSEDAPELDTIIGQDRAVRSLHFGLDIKEKGFNIYLAGIHGTGRTTAIELYLKDYAAQKPVPSDWCYVYNFADPGVPNALELPPGKATTFRDDMEHTVNTAIEDLQTAFKSEEYTKLRNERANEIQSQKQAIINNLGQHAQSEGFVLQPSPMGLLTIPIREGKPISDQEFLQLSQEEKEVIQKKQASLKTYLEKATREVQDLDNSLRKKIDEMNQEVARFAIQHHFNACKDNYKDLEEIPEHIDHVREDILKNVDKFITEEDEKKQPQIGRRRVEQSPLQRYAVNVLVDNSELDGAPVILELNPTFSNLVGQSEKEMSFGALITNFTLIQPGCLHKANGGFLVMPIEDLIRNPGSWDALKRALANEEIVIEDISERFGFSTKSLRPEPIPLDIKIILLGDPMLYQMLLQYDVQFTELFKVKSDFDTQMPRNEENIREYISFVCTLCKSEDLNHLDRSALARVIEHASRMSNDQSKLSTRFGEMSDVIREANYYANQDKSDYIQGSHVEQAVEQRFYRSSLIRDRIQEMIMRDMIKIAVSGEQVGQVNGLSVLGLGDITFGQPSRITASISLGREGVINIEREAEMSGPIHTKGVLIISGYLADKFAQEKPLSLSARLVFEQSYSGVDGDSASSTELYALLSALSNFPIKQSIAVTGSVNQKGEVQVIGGVNEKIEGFFEICRLKGLTGDQGVMIPKGNIENLMLKKPILDAVEAGKFHIWSVKSIDEGIEILTGVKAGQRMQDGQFESGTVYSAVDKKLGQLADQLAKYSRYEGRY